MDEKTEDLSNDAKAMLLFFLNMRSTLTFQGDDGCASHRASSGLAELIQAGLVRVRRDGPAAIYQMTAAGQAVNRRELTGGNVFRFMDKHGKFSIVSPIMKIAREE